jgi:AcrR family transcriptional regulator
VSFAYDVRIDKPNLAGRPDWSAMARRGWGGAPPVDDDDARRRIVEAAMRCIDRRGPVDTTLSDVATELSVTRQTVYRYFPGTDELFTAVGQVAVEAYIDELAAHLRWRTDPADWVVEALASAIERLPDHPYLTLLLVAGRPGAFSKGMTTGTGIRISRTLLERSHVDWRGAGYVDGDVDELVEVMLRMLQSIVIDPPQPLRTGAALRRFLERWVAPAVAAVPAVPR